jgi:hypothetical protein
MSSTRDKVFNALKNAESPGEVALILSQDPLLVVGILAILGLIYLFGRIYLWPWINPLQIKWINDLWEWATSPRKPTPAETYPYAKVIYPTYR